LIQALIVVRKAKKKQIFGGGEKEQTHEKSHRAEKLHEPHTQEGKALPE
jgi:hypothetical protein